MAPPIPTPTAKIESELRSAIWSLLPLFRRSFWFSLAITLLSLGPIVYMQEVYGRVVNSRSVETLLMLSLLLVAIIALQEFLEWIRSEVLTGAGVDLNVKLAERVFNASFDANLRKVPGATQALSDLREIRSFLGSMAMPALIDAPLASIFLLMIFLISPRMGFFACLGAVAMAITNVMTERKVKPTMDAAQRAAGEAQTYARSMLRNAPVVEAMGMMDAVEARWLKSQRRFLYYQAQASDHAGTSAAMSRMIMMAQGSLLLGFGCFLTLEGVIPDGGSAMIIASILGGRALQPLMQMISMWKMVVSARQAFGRLDHFLEAVPARERGMPLPPPQGQLSVEGLVVNAPGQPLQILRGVSFVARPGEVLAVVGPSASGKSTLARALVGVWPAAAGAVRLDGVSVHAWHKSELGRHIGYLPQDVELFEGNLAENIARFDDVDEAALDAAIDAAGLRAVVAGLPQGLATPIGDDGAILSGGQRQRVGLARAIYRVPRLIVLDEPNSSLDEAGERDLLQILNWLKAQGSTVVVITHRTGVLAAADRMLVLTEGQVRLFGPRDEVMAKLRGVTAPAGAQPAAAAGGPAAARPAA
ncbi:MAG: type I secretion system permease/ATPase [Rhodocyclaceae bacterium]|nr:type I secretion system permease/ATPase [Rhodocyclaceae bacterium]